MWEALTVSLSRANCIRNHNEATFAKTVPATIARSGEDLLNVSRISRGQRDRKKDYVALQSLLMARSRRRAH